MSGLGFLPCLTFTPFAVPKIYCVNHQPSFQVTNGGLTQPKCMKKSTTIKAEVRVDIPKRGDEQLKVAELTIKEIPYVEEVVKRLSQNSSYGFRKTEPDSDPVYVEEAYQRCRIFCVEREDLMLTVSRQLTEEQARALWAIFAYGRRIDNLIDSNEDENTRSTYVDHWEERTKDILIGRPHDILDAALAHTTSKFHIDAAPFEDLLKGMRMDIKKKRYANFEELFLFCYCMCGTIALMLPPILGISPESTISSKIIHEGLIYTGIALQLTNILKDVTDDAQLGRVYLPQDELAQFGLCDEHIFSRKVTSGWREFMKKQIDRVRFYYKLGEQGVSQLDKSSRSKILAGVMMYRHILDEIEEKNYDNLTNKVGEITF